MSAFDHVFVNLDFADDILDNLLTQVFSPAALAFVDDRALEERTNDSLEAWQAETEYYNLAWKGQAGSARALELMATWEFDEDELGLTF